MSWSLCKVEDTKPSRHRLRTELEEANARIAEDTAEQAKSLTRQISYSARLRRSSGDGCAVAFQRVQRQTFDTCDL